MKHRILAFLVAVGVVLTSISCVHEMKKSELQNEIQAHAAETINNVWYAGSTDTHDFFIHNTTMRSRKLRVPKGEVSIPNRFPATKDRNKWLLMKSDTDMGLKGNPIDSLPPGVKLQTEGGKGGTKGGRKGGQLNNTQIKETTRQRVDWGEAEVKTVVDPEGEAITRTLRYVETGPNTGRVFQETHSDGSWTRYHYDSNGRIETRASAVLDADASSTEATSLAMIQRYTPVDPDDTEENRDQQIPRTLTEYTKGVVTRVTYHAFLRSDDGSRIAITEQAAPGNPYGAAENQRTVRTFYPP